MRAIPIFYEDSASVLPLFVAFFKKIDAPLLFIFFVERRTNILTAGLTILIALVFELLIATLADVAFLFFFFFVVYR